MPDGINPQHIEEWMTHIRVLAEDIGPRGSTTDAEQRAAEYAAQHFEQIGLEPCVEAFTSATSSYLFFVIVGLFFVAAFAVYPLAGRASAAVALLIAAIGLYSVCMELSFRDNPVRLIQPKGKSQNVYTRLEPTGEHRHDLILVGHLDTNHAALIFRSPRWVDAWRVLASIFFFGFVAAFVIDAVGLVTQATLIWPMLSLPGLLSGIGLAGFCLEGELAPFTHGANDNATAAGLVLHLAQRLKAERLNHTRVWFVCTGCEEVKHYGAVDFFKRHRGELVSPRALVFEMLGRDGPGYLMKESTISLFAFRASPEMVQIAQEVARQHPELGAHPTQVDGGHTEMTDAIRYGVPAITLIGLDAGGTRWNYDGPELYWHQKQDRVENLLADVLERNYQFTWEFIQTLDQTA